MTVEMTLDTICENETAIRTARDTFATLPAFAEKYLIVDCLDLLLSNGSSPVRTIALSTLQALAGKISQHREDLERVLAAVRGEPETSPLPEDEAMFLLSKWLAVGTTGNVGLPCERPSGSCMRGFLAPELYCESCRVVASTTTNCLELRSCWQRDLPANQICSGCLSRFPCQRIPAGFKSCLLSNSEKLCESCAKLAAFKAELYSRFDFNLRRLVRDYRAMWEMVAGYDYDAAMRRLFKLYGAAGQYPHVRTFARYALMCDVSKLPRDVRADAMGVIAVLEKDSRPTPEIFIEKGIAQKREQ